MSSYKNAVGNALALLVGCYASLAAALTGRFLWLILIGRISGAERYSDYLSTSLAAFWNSLPPAVLVFFGLVVAYRRFVDPMEPKRRWMGEFTLLCGFFAFMLFVSLLIGGTVTFPRTTWALAWLVGSIAFGLRTVTRSLETENIAQRVLYTRGTQLILDAIVVAGSFFFAYLVRFDGLPDSSRYSQLLFGLPYLILLYLGVNYLWGIYSIIWRFISLKESLVIAQSVGTSALIALIGRILGQDALPDLRIPFGVLLIHPLACYAGLVAVRVFRRLHYRHLAERNGSQGRSRPIKRLLLLGAGETGARLAGDLERRPEMKIIGFLDDDRRKQNRSVRGFRVLGSTKRLSEILQSERIDEAVLCMPRAPKSKARELVAQCEEVSVRITTVPSLSDIVLGKLTPMNLRPIRMEDLLGRDSVECTFGQDVIECYRHRRILITGAAGSIGSELTRQLSLMQPSELILLDKDENGLYEIGLEIREQFEGRVTDVVADVRDRARLIRLFRRCNPEVVFHASAYKHVPMMERDPSEAITTNVIGTRNIVELCTHHEVRSFLLISTDKAVNPTSIMGASKRVAEMIVQQQSLLDSKTRFCCVRFGNVLGSRASVVPVFQKRIAEGKPLQVTHPEIRRFFMTIPEAVQLVIQAGSMGEQGEIFLLDMGDPVKIVDLARELIELSGLAPGQDIPIEFTGLRPGEKLYEELLIDTENGDRSTKFPKIFVANASDRSWPHLAETVRNLEQAAREEDSAAIYQLLEFLEIGYKSRSRSVGQPESAKPLH